MNVNIDGLLGFEVEGVFIGHGSMFELDFGGRFSESVATIKGRSHEWRLWVQCSEWELLQDDDVLVHSESDRSVIEDILVQLKGSIVMAFTFPSDTMNGAIVKFSNEMLLRLDLHKLGKEYDSWCLFTPEDGVVVQDGEGTLFFEAEQSS